jgi:hypothetical protein
VPWTVYEYHGRDRILPHPSRLKIAQDWLYQDHVQDHVLLAHYGLTLAAICHSAAEFEDLAKDLEKHAAEREAHNRAKTQPRLSISRQGAIG